MEPMIAPGNGESRHFAMPLSAKPPALDESAPRRREDGATTEDRLRWFFPLIEMTDAPVSYRVVVQMARIEKQTAGGVIKTPETLVQDRIYQTLGKVVGLGASAFTDMTTGRLWPSAPWYRLGDYVRCPVQGGFRIWPETLPHNLRDVIEFRYYNERDILALVDRLDLI